MSYASLGATAHVDRDCYLACKDENPSMVLVNGQKIPEHTYCSQKCIVGGAAPPVYERSSNTTLWIAAGATVAIVGAGIFLLRRKR